MLEKEYGLVALGDIKTDITYWINLYLQHDETVMPKLHMSHEAAQEKAKTSGNWIGTFPVTVSKEMHEKVRIRKR